MVTQADSRKWMACLYNSFLFMEAKIMKMAKKLLAVVLTGVMAVSMLTGCALGDLKNENALLKTLNVYGKADGFEYKSKDEVTISGTKYELKKAAEKIESCVKDDTIKDQDVTGAADLKTKLAAAYTKKDATNSPNYVFVVCEMGKGNNAWSVAAKAANTELQKAKVIDDKATTKVVPVYAEAITAHIKMTGDTAAKDHNFVVIVAVKKV